MKNILVIALVVLQTAVSGQSFSPGQQAVIDAENSFAGMSKAKNTRDAFMAYLSDSTIMFDNKNKPVEGIKLWVNGKPDSTLLFWWPVFVGVSADGALGFSTGPWQWSKNRESQPAGFGYYATIWQKDKEGKWKMGVDLGISFPETEKSNPALKASPTSNASINKNSTAKQELFAIDQAYSYHLKDSSVSFVANEFTSDGHLLRKGHKPYPNPAEFPAAEERKGYVFSQSGGGIAGSQDLGYVYGTVMITTTKDDEKTTEDKIYLRVWKKESGGWKIVLDVLTSN
ncbi:MAG: hypothetical protein ABIR18_14835 [Chitinophagaceae bacterium]